jgi:hypothetical protein
LPIAQDRRGRDLSTTPSLMAMLKLALLRKFLRFLRPPDRT